MCKWWNMNRLFVLILLIGLAGYSCYNSKTSNITVKKAPKTDAITEYIGVVKLNGIINFRDNIKSVEEKLGSSETKCLQISDQKDSDGTFSSNISYFDY